MVTVDAGYDYISHLVQVVLDESYNSATGQTAFSRALTHWAMQNILVGRDLNQADLVEATEIGGSDDCGIDGFYYEEEDGILTLHVFQTKASLPSQTLAEEDVVEIRNSIANLLNPERNKNQIAAGLASDLRTWLASGNLIIQMYLITTGQIVPNTAADAKIKLYREEHDLHEVLNSENITIPYDYIVYKTPELQEAHADLLRMGEQTGQAERFRVITTGEKVAFFETFADNEPTLFCIAYAVDIAKIFNGPPKKWYLFNENPRGAQQKKNASIWKTLMDEYEKTRFHAMNNGLSIVCSDYKTIEDSSGNVVQIEITDMRIVNGCQTTVTLGEALAPKTGEPIIDERVLVQLRVTKTSSSRYRTDISRATNTQKQVTAADMASLRDEMRQYQELFGTNDPSYFLEIQTGRWDYMMTSTEKDDYEARIQRDTLAQSVMAINGRPGEALEDRRYIFIKRSADPKGRFEEVFESNIPVATMVLSWKIHEKVQNQLQVQENTYDQSIADGETPNPLNRPSARYWSSLHRVWLLAKVIAHHYSFSSLSDELQSSVARSLANSIDAWFPVLYEPVNEAISDGMQRLEDLYPQAERRDLFRRSHSTVKDGIHVPNTVFEERLIIALDRAGVKDRIGDVIGAGETP